MFGFNKKVIEEDPNLNKVLKSMRERPDDWELFHSKDFTGGVVARSGDTGVRVIPEGSCYIMSIDGRGNFTGSHDLNLDYKSRQRLEKAYTALLTDMAGTIVSRIEMSADY